MKLPIIKNNLALNEQLNKVNEEIEELNEEFKMLKFRLENNENVTIARRLAFTFELLDSITSLVNLYHKAYEIGVTLGEDEWHEKMKRYESEKGYDIEKWIKLEEEVNEETI